MTVLAAPMPLAPSTAASAEPPGRKAPTPGIRGLLLPDLVVSASYLIQPCTVEGNYSRLKIQATMKNQGMGPASVTGDRGIAVTAYPNVTLTVPAQYQMKVVTHGRTTLKPGTSSSVQLELVIGPAKNNKGYGIVVQVDPDRVVKETNESNNTIIGVDVPALKNYCTAL